MTDSHVAKTFMPASAPRPAPGRDDGPFWEAAREHRLVAQRCADCRTFRHPPLPLCWNCHSKETEWVESSGDGIIVTFTIIRRCSNPALRELVPYPIVVVEIPDLDGIRMLGNLVDWESAGVSIGQAVHVVWDDFDDVTIPQFASRTGPPPQSSNGAPHDS